MNERTSAETKMVELEFPLGSQSNSKGNAGGVLKVLSQAAQLAQDALEQRSIGATVRVITQQQDDDTVFTLAVSYVEPQGALDKVRKNGAVMQVLANNFPAAKSLFKAPGRIEH